MSNDTIQFFTAVRDRLVGYLNIIRGVDMRSFPAPFRAERHALLLTYQGVWDDADIATLEAELGVTLYESYMDVMDFVVRVGEHLGTDLTGVSRF